MQTLYSITSASQVGLQKLLLILLCSFLLVACRNDSNEQYQKNADIQEASKKKQQQLIAAWLAAPMDSLDNDFYIATDTGKVLSFQIDSTDVDSLLAEAERLTGDSLYLRVFMALDETAPNAGVKAEPDFRPILDLTNEPSQTINDEMLFEMDYLDMHIIKYLDTLLKSTTLSNSPGPDIPISIPQAKQFIVGWNGLPQAKIAKVMYADSVPIGTERIKYYTFNSSDTKDALKHLKMRPNDLLYLHLGLNAVTDAIPLCVILHLDDPARIADFADFDDQNPPFFEFAAPCPRACGNQ
jgi:hypothetical protein